MQHPFSVLRGEYTALLASARVLGNRTAEIDHVARKLIGFLPRYEQVSKQTGVPAVWMSTVFEREAASNFHLYFGNGDPLNRVTRHVPKGRGPFASWEAGAIDALHIDRIDAVKDWSWPSFCYEGELWNGFGPRNHGVHTGYLWAGTTAYTGGKYVADGVWDPRHYDTQLGIVPVAQRMIALRPDLALPGAPAPVDIDADDHAPPAPAPIGVGTDKTRWLQASLNRLRVAGTPITVDGSYGRETKRAVLAFQISTRFLDRDGLAGPKTIKALQHALEDL